MTFSVVSNRPPVLSDLTGNQEIGKIKSVFDGNDRIFFDALTHVFPVSLDKLSKDK